MIENAKVIIFTQIYNTKPYIEQCVNSVLSQTYSNFEYVILDNGSTDGSGEILKRFAEVDKRIRLVRHEINKPYFYHRFFQEIATGEYVTNLDSDDWWEPDYLERLVGLAESTGADIVCTGKQMHEEWTGRAPRTKAPRRFVFDRAQFAEYYPVYRPFFMSVWGKIVSTNVVKCMNVNRMDHLMKINGADIIVNIEFLRHAQRICIDDSLLYHYRLREGSAFHDYDPHRLESNRVVCEQWREFLLSFGPLSRTSEHHLTCLRATFCQQVIRNATTSFLSSMEKLCEYKRILLDPLNADLYKWQHPYVRKRLRDVLKDILHTGAELQTIDEEIEAVFATVMRTFAPRCGAAVSLRLCALFLDDDTLLEALLHDNADGLMERLVALTGTEAANQDHDLGAAFCALTTEHPTLHGIDDLEFIRNYPEVYLSLWREEYAQAMEMMTNLLKNGKADKGTFLELYLSLAAVGKDFQMYLDGEAYKEESSEG